MISDLPIVVSEVAEWLQASKLPCWALSNANTGHSCPTPPLHDRNPHTSIHREPSPVDQKDAN